VRVRWHFDLVAVGSTLDLDGCIAIQDVQYVPHLYKIVVVWYEQVPDAS
jgi:hypothetical protein